VATKTAFPIYGALNSALPESCHLLNPYSQNLLLDVVFIAQECDATKVS
jgi:hypothetical protein